MSRKRFVFLPFVAGMLLVSAWAAGACGDDDDAGSAHAENTGVITAIVFLDNAGLHAIDESINKKEVPATAQSVMLKGATVIKLTTWPSETAAAARALGETMAQLAAELDKDPVDFAKAGELAKKVHDGEHDLSHEVWEHLQGEAGVSGGGSAHDD